MAMHEGRGGQGSHGRSNGPAVTQVLRWLMDLHPVPNSTLKQACCALPLHHAVPACMLPRCPNHPPGSTGPLIVFIPLVSQPSISNDIPASPEPWPSPGGHATRHPTAYLGGNALRCSQAPQKTYGARWLHSILFTRQSHTPALGSPLLP